MNNYVACHVAEQHKTALIGTMARGAYKGVLKPIGKTFFGNMRRAGATLTAGSTVGFPAMTMFSHPRRNRQVEDAWQQAKKMRAQPSAAAARSL